MTRMSLFALIMLTTAAHAAEGPQEKNLDKAIAEMQMHQHTNDAYADPAPVASSDQSAKIEEPQDMMAESHKASQEPDGDSDGH